MAPVITCASRASARWLPNCSGDQAPGSATAVFALGDVQAPASPVASFARGFNPAYLSLLGPLLIVYLIVMMSPARGSGGMFKTADKPETRFSDVIGVEEAKDALQDIVAYLRNPRRFSQLGAKPPKGVVLEGHYGCGKTLLARAVAGEAGVPFIALAGGDFSDMFLGVGVRRVKKLFALARKQAHCVLFIDEIDGLGKRAGGNSAGETENNRIINTLLVELDGFSSQIGPFSYAGLPQSAGQASNNPEAIAEAREMIKGVERECQELLLANRGALDRLTAQLLEHETVSGVTVDECLTAVARPAALAA